MEAAAESSGRRRLSEVVSECVNRWFNDTLKEAKGGDAAMQVLVGQMYCSGYGVVRDAQKVLLAFFDVMSPVFVFVSLLFWNCLSWCDH